MTDPYWIIHLPTRLTSRDAVTDLAIALRDSLAHVGVLDFGEVTLSEEDHQRRRYRVWCELPFEDGDRCPLRDSHPGPCRPDTP